MRRKTQHIMEKAWRDIHSGIDEDLIPEITFTAKMMFEAGMKISEQPEREDFRVIDRALQLGFNIKNRKSGQELIFVKGDVNIWACIKGKPTWCRAILKDRHYIEHEYGDLISLLEKE